MSESLTIGELARRTHITTSALHYYDERRLVRAPWTFTKTLLAKTVTG